MISEITFPKFESEFEVSKLSIKRRKDGGNHNRIQTELIAVIALPKLGMGAFIYDVRFLGG